MFKVFQESKSIKWMYNQKNDTDFSPAYQRNSSLWNKKQKQLLIDSILNGLDIPKFYFQFMPPSSGGSHYNYAIIDGKQRIETILGFIDDDFPLSTSFRFLDEKRSRQFGDVSGKLFSELEVFAPALIARFWQYELNIVLIDTTSPDLINELFVRLNSGIAVSTAEKRNANGGILSREIQKLCDTSIFFTNKVKMANRRFAKNDLALKLLMIEMGEWNLTRTSVDKFVNDNREFHSCIEAFEALKNKLDGIAGAFEKRDRLLSKKNFIITIYSILPDINRNSLRPFLEYFENAREAAQQYDSNVLLNEFTRLLQQGADKKSSIQERRNIMRQYIYEFLKDN